MANADAQRSLELAARTFWWRPQLALQRAFMLEAYARAGVRFATPLADLGCANSLFASALAARGVFDSVDVGLDYLMEDLQDTVRRPRRGVVRGDLRRLPFATGSLGSAFSNCVLSSFVGDGAAELKPALAEIRRVLRPGAPFVACVATPAYARNATSYRLARGLGRAELAVRIERWIDRRNDHTILRDRAGWTSLLEEAGLAVEAVRPVVGQPYADTHRWLAALKGADLPRRLGLKAVGAMQASAQAGLFRGVLGSSFAAEVDRIGSADPAEAGFLLLVARRP